MLKSMVMTAGVIGLLLPAAAAFAQGGERPEPFQSGLYRMEHTSEGAYSSQTLNDIKAAQAPARPKLATQVPPRNPGSTLHASR